MKKTQYFNKHINENSATIYESYRIGVMSDITNLYEISGKHSKNSFIYLRVIEKIFVTMNIISTYRIDQDFQFPSYSGTIKESNENVEESWVQDLIHRRLLRETDDGFLGRERWDHLK